MTSTGRLELPIYESQAVCGLLRNSNFEELIGKFGEGELSRTDDHHRIKTIQELLSKCLEKNNRIMSCQAAISNLKGRANNKNELHREMDKPSHKNESQRNKKGNFSLPKSLDVKQVKVTETTETHSKDRIKSKCNNLS